ncbi:MAG: AraC family transcriptional regulator [Cyanobium sp. NAT70]|nr:AraC family transcriptional regulator [Cyanobium sp. NAT70]
MRKKRPRDYIFTDTIEMEEYCRAHFEDYHSDTNFSCNVTQLSAGTLRTSTICAPIKDVHLEIFKTNQTLLYEEEANTRSVAFCWIDKKKGQSHDVSTIISGHKMQLHSIAGFNRINKTGGNIWDVVGANENLCCMSLKWEKLQARIHRLNAFNAYAKLEECIGIDSDSHASKQLKKLFNDHFSNQPVKNLSSSFYDLAIACLEDADDNSSFGTARCESIELIEDLVKLIHEDRSGLPPITLSEITEYLDSQKESLNLICKSTFKMGVIELVKRIRLEQARKAYSSPHMPKGLKIFTRQRIAHYYGFKNWSNFERLYYYSFKENPLQTIERVSKSVVGIKSLWGGE